MKTNDKPKIPQEILNKIDYSEKLLEKKLNTKIHYN